MSNISICGGVGDNTGPIECDVRRGIPKLPLLGGASFAPADYISSEVFEPLFVAKTKLANGSPDKLFPFPEIQNVANNTEANVTGTAGLGLQFVLREGKPAYTFGVVIGSSLEKQLRKFNTQIVPMFMLDSNGNVWGKLDADGNFVGCRVQVFVSPKPWSDGASVDTEYTLVSLTYQSAQEYADETACAQTDFTVSDLEGLVNVYGSQPAAAVSNVYKILWSPKGTSLTNKAKIFDLYADELAVASLWSMATGATFGTPLAITSVAKDTTLGCWTVTADSTAHTALPAGAKIQIRLDPPADLEAADVFDIEAIPYVVTKG